MPSRNTPPSRLQRALAWAGVVLLFGSFAWLQILPPLELTWRSRSETTARLDAGTVVVIDPGHGGQDSGMIHAGVLEKDLALDVARRVDRLLLAKGIPTLLTRSGDNYISLAGRAAAANREQSAVFVSIHFDEARPTATGVETYFGAHQVTATPTLVSWIPFLSERSPEQANLESQSLAGIVQEAVVAKTHAANRGTRAEPFYVIDNVRHPAVLIEGGFLTNRDEAAKLLTEEYREQLASGIVDGIVKYRQIVRDRQRNTLAAVPGT